MPASTIMFRRNSSGCSAVTYRRSRTSTVSGSCSSKRVTGQPIDMGGSQAAILEKRRKVPDLGAIDLRLKPLITEMLAPDPAARPASMAHVATWPLPTSRPNDDRYAADLSRSAERRHSSSGRSGKRWMAVAATVALIAIGGAGALYVLQPGAPRLKEPPPPPPLGPAASSAPKSDSSLTAALPPPAAPTLTPSSPSPSPMTQPTPASPPPAASSVPSPAPPPRRRPLVRRRLRLPRWFRLPPCDPIRPRPASLPLNLRRRRPPRSRARAQRNGSTAARRPRRTDHALHQWL